MGQLEMKNKILIALIGFLVLLNVVSLLNNIHTNDSIASIQNKIQSIPKEPIVYIGKDGRTPVKGIDYRDGDNGKAGINSISFITTQTVIKEVPLMGTPGKDGVNGENAPTQEIQVNPDTYDIETKLSNLRGWNLLVKCSEYRLECPSGN